MEYINLGNIIREKLLKDDISKYDFNIVFFSDELKIKLETKNFYTQIPALVTKYLQDLNISYEFEKVSENKTIIKLYKDSFELFQKRVIKNAKIKWVIEELSANFSWTCNSDESSVEFESNKYFYDTEEDAMIAYFNLTMYKNEWGERYIVLAPKKILYFDI